MRDPRVPDTSANQPMTDVPSSHAPAQPVAPVPGGITPQDPSSMPRGEDDAETRRNSPEFHDRPGPGATKR